MKARAITCPHQPPTRSDNTVSVAQGGTATPGAIKQLLPPEMVFKKLIYIYIYARSTKRRNCIVRSSSFLVQFVIFKMLLFSAVDIITHACSNRFLVLRNHTGMAIPRAFHSC